MSRSSKWWAVAAGAVTVSAVGVMAFAGVSAAGSINEANAAQAFTRQLSGASAGMERAWAEAVHADALAVSSGAKARARFDEAMAHQAEHTAVLSALGVEELDQVSAAVGAGFAALEESMTATIDIVEKDSAMAAYTNHTERSLAISASMAPVFDGLSDMVRSADAEVAAALTSGASTLRSVSIASGTVGALGFAALAVAIVAWRGRRSAAGSGAQEQGSADLRRAA